MSGSEVDPRVRALARELETSGKKVTELDTLVRQLAGDVARLACVVTAGRPASPVPDAEAGEAGPPAVRSWLLASDPQQGVLDVEDLVEWLDRVYLRYQGAELAPCWLWHPHVVEELWWLRRAHADAYDPKDGSWLRVGDWHDRARPNVVRRVGEAIASCELALHQDGKVHGRDPKVAPLAAHSAQIAVAWTTDGTRPDPTDVQLAESETYLQALHARHR